MLRRGGTTLILVGESHIVPPGLRQRVRALLGQGKCIAVEGVDKAGYPEKLLGLIYVPLKGLVRLGMLGPGAILTAETLFKKKAVCLHRLEEGHRLGAREKIEIGILLSFFVMAVGFSALGWTGYNLARLPLWLWALYLTGFFCMLQLAAFGLFWPAIARSSLLRSLWLMGPGIVFTRNETMAARLMELLERGDLENEIVMIVGRMHLGHLERNLLRETYGFSSARKACEIGE